MKSLVIHVVDADGNPISDYTRINVYSIAGYPGTFTILVDKGNGYIEVEE